MQELTDMGLIASMRQSLRLIGNWDSSELHLRLFQSILLSFDTNPQQCINIVISVRLCACVCVCVWNYTTALLLIPRAAFGLQAEELFLEFHQLRPQGVLLSQDMGDHGLSFISWYICLKRQHINFWTPSLLFTEQRVHKHVLFMSHAYRNNRGQFLTWSHICNTKHGKILYLSSIHCLNMSMYKLVSLFRCVKLHVWWRVLWIAACSLERWIMFKSYFILQQI